MTFYSDFYRRSVDDSVAFCAEQASRIDFQTLPRRMLDAGDLTKIEDPSSLQRIKELVAHDVLLQRCQIQTDLQTDVIWRPWHNATVLRPFPSHSRIRQSVQPCSGRFLKPANASPREAKVSGI